MTVVAAAKKAHLLSYVYKSVYCTVKVLIGKQNTSLRGFLPGSEIYCLVKFHEIMRDLLVVPQ